MRWRLRSRRRVSMDTPSAADAARSVRRVGISMVIVPPDGWGQAADAPPVMLKAASTSSYWSCRAILQDDADLCAAMMMICPCCHQILLLCRGILKIDEMEVQLNYLHWFT